MKKHFILVNRHFHDLNPIGMGFQSCESGYSYGPCVRNHYLIHYVDSGEGILQKNGQTYRVKAGDAFLILPEDCAFYQADSLHPWTYYWFNFDGALAESFRDLPPVFSVSSEPFLAIKTVDDNSPTREYFVTGLLFRLYSDAFSGKKYRNHYVRRVEDYIQAMYMQEVRVEELSEMLNLDRRYLSRLFKEKTGTSLQDYLIDVRMEEAKKLLEKDYGVAEAASNCGYPDPSNFSRMFKRRFGISPAEWKRKS